MEESQKITATIVIEILGAPKEHVEETMRMVIEKLKKEKDVRLLRETTYKAEQIKQLWSTFSDLDIEVSSLHRLIGLCFDYMPSSVDIVSPIDIKLHARDATSAINDLLANLHKQDMLIKNAIAENTWLKQAMQKGMSSAAALDARKVADAAKAAKEATGHSDDIIDVEKERESLKRRGK